jgi:hypothetical protein
LYLKIYREHLKHNDKRATQLKNGQRIWTEISLKTDNNQ